MKITINGVLHDQQRYDTVGDWYWYSSRTYDFDARGKSQTEWNPKDMLQVTVSHMSDWRHMALVAVHELIEAVLCKAEGVMEEQVDAWDESYEGFTGLEPGEHPMAPYHTQHMFAEAIERLVALRLGVSWSEYTKAVEEVGK